MKKELDEQVKRASLQQLLWILYSDVTSRFDILIEECAHLQDTILGLVDSRGVIDQIINSCQNCQSAGFDRPVVGDLKAHKNYYDAPVRDRAFLCLWNTLGGMIEGLVSNQRQHTEEYKKVLGRFQVEQRGAVQNEMLYWFISSRGYFLNTVFGTYTAQLEHAHEKLIQMLENQAGTLPAPILFRRWNSAVYGEFLSEYSRQVNWETRTLVRGLQRKTSEGRPPQSITHTWTHYPTSLTRYFDVEVKEKTSGERKVQRFAIIQSAYFYLEQPILFPLLYHECAHINFPQGEEVRLNHKDFFGARLAAIESLRRASFQTMPSPSITYENFWDHFTEEVWADAMALALGGRAYLLPLALQLTGVSGGDAFNHFRIDDDTIYPLNKLGGVKYRKYEAQAPILDDAYFWEARLLVACWVFESFPFDDTDSDEAANTLSISGAIRAVIANWWRSGEDAFHEDKISPEHAGLWQYRREINEWVFETIQSYLKPCTSGLHSNAKFSGAYDIASHNTLRHIESEVQNYCGKYIKQSNRGNSFRSNGIRRLENVALDIKWRVSADILHKLSRPRNNIEYWTESFVSWARNESCVAYRIALEASRIRMSLLDELADMLEENGLGKCEANNNCYPLWREVLKTEDADVQVVIRTLKAYPEVRQKLLRCRDLTAAVKPLRRKQKVSAKVSYQNQAGELKLLNKIDGIVDDVMGALGGLATTDSGMAGRDAGTLTLGVIRPSEFVATEVQKNGSVYVHALDAVKSRLEEAAIFHTKKIKSDACASTDSQKVSSVIVPLIGEYQFLSYTTNSTPVERDFHPADTPRLLTKPRFVVHIGGLPLEELVTRHQNSWGRVALIRFKYKWKWLDLLSKLKENESLASNRQIENFSLYLSSAWEDVVLVTMHAEPQDVWSLRKLNLGIGDNCGVDIQSNYIVPKNRLSAESLVNDNLPEGWEFAKCWDDKFKTWAKSSRLVSRIYRRSGRFDYTVVWKDLRSASPSSELQACAQGLASMPKPLWAQITSMLSSYEEHLFSADRDGAASPYKAVTHFAVEDRHRPYLNRVADGNG